MMTSYFVQRRGLSRDEAGVVCTIPLLERALGRQAKRATIGYIVYKRLLYADCPFAR